MKSFSYVDAKQTHYLYKVKNVLDGQTLQLEDERKLRLIGVKEIDGKTREYIKKLIGSNLILIELDELQKGYLNKDKSDNYLAYVYIWGGNFDGFDRSKLEYSGFLSIKKSPLDWPRKGGALFLNATLLRLGVADLDFEYDHSYKDIFKKIRE